MTFIRAHPALFFERSAIRFVRFWMGTGSNPASVIFAIHAVLTTSFGWLGLWRLFKRGNSSLAVLFLVPLVLFPLPYYITHAEFRYRLIIDPLLTILAGYWIIERRQRGIAVNP